METLLLENLSPEDIKIAEARAAGKSYRTIEKEYDIDRCTANYTANKPEMRILIKSLHEELINSSLKAAKDNISHLVNNYLQFPKDDWQLREHGFKASVKMMESVGIFPAHSPSILIQQQFNTQINTSPVVDNVIAMHQDAIEYNEEEQ